MLNLLLRDRQVTFRMRFLFLFDDLDQALQHIAGGLASELLRDCAFTAPIAAVT
jgi:hypothetical protein